VNSAVPAVLKPPSTGGTAGALAYQKYTMDLNAEGASLGKGLRVAPEANAGFSNPPISGSQFGSSGNAKASFSAAPGGI